MVYSFYEWVDTKDIEEEISNFLQRISQHVLTTAKKVGNRIAFTFPKQPVTNAIKESKIGRPKKPGSEEEWANRHKKGWQIYKSLQTLTDPEKDLGWSKKQQTQFKKQLTSKIRHIATPLGFLFETEVFLYLKNKGLYDADKGAMEVEKIQEQYISEIQKFLKGATELTLQMVRTHAADLGDQIVEKTKNILGCADMIWFMGGRSVAWSGRKSPADIYVGCSEAEAANRPGFSIKFGTETRINIATLRIKSVFKLLSPKKGYDYFKKLGYNPEEADSHKEWAEIISEMLAKAAKPIEGKPTRFTQLLNYLLTGGEYVLPAPRNYASTQTGGVDWSDNIRKDFIISKDPTNPLKPRKGANVDIELTSGYMKMKYSVEGGSHSGTTLYFIPRDEKVNIKMTNLTSGRR